MTTPDSRQSESADLNDPITLPVTRAQAWTVYDLLVSRAVALESAETEGRCYLGSRHYRDAANSVREALS